MSLVLAIEPDHRQAMTLKRVVREIVKAELVLVDSRDAAIAALDAQIPDVILVTALLSPRDEEELFTHLRALDGAEHLQTHTIPQLAGSRGDTERKGGGGLLSKFRKKKEAEPNFGCDPDLFAEEIRTFLARAAQMKAEAVTTLQNRVAQLEAQVDAPPAAAKPGRRPKGRFDPGAPTPRQMDEPHVQPPAVEPVATGDGSAWDSPFEWRRSEPPAAIARNDAQPAEQPGVESTPPPQPLITNVPLAVLAAEEESRANDEQREAERRRMEEERVRLEAAAASERERAERLSLEADQRRLEADRLRAEADAQATAAVARAREEERKKGEAAAKVVAERAREEERKRLEAEAKAAAQRAREDERRKAEAEAAAATARAREDERKKAEAAKAAADKAREEERRRLEAEAKAAAQRAREEERKKAETEAKAAAERAREDERRKLEAKLAAERAKETERRRLEAEAAAKREREAERLRKEAEAVAEKKRQEERRRLEAEAAKAAEKAREEERRRLEAERRRLEAEALVERERAERRRIEGEAAAERERAAAAERERLAAAEAERREAAVRERAAQRKRNRRANRGGAGAEAPLVVSDQFAEFREEYDHVGPGVFRLMPLAAWARTEQPGNGNAEAEPQAPDDLRELMAGWTLPPHVAGITYARGCRIRRVRVPAAEGAKKERGARPVIVSRRALDEARSSDI